MVEAATLSSSFPHCRQTSSDEDIHQENTRRGSDASSVLSLQILRQRLQNTVSSFQPKKTNETWYRIEKLPATTRSSSFSANAVGRTKRSNSIAQPSSAETRRPSTRRTVSSGNLIKKSATISINQQTSGREQRKTSQGVILYERRKSAVPKCDKSGSISYTERKNMRRGSLFVAQQIPRTIRTIYDDNEGSDSASVTEEDDFVKPAAFDIRRQSLQLPFNLIRRSRRGSADSAMSGASSVDSEAALRSQMAANLNRRRRSRAPAALAEEIALIVPRQSNPEAGAKLAKYFRIVKVCVSLCTWSYTRAEEKKDSFLGFAQVDSEEHNLEKLFFNPSYFKANKQQRLTEETKQILTLASWKRTKEDVRYVQIALRNIRAFAEYPLDMQYKLSRVGWLEEYGPKRAILRQGHLPDAFYFIISGTLVVTVLDLSKGKPMPQTVAFLKRGDSFGELAILNNTRRASTVITKDIVQLLCISVEDFEDIFMLAGGMKSVTDPARNAFIRSLNMFQHWPLQVLADHPQDCLFHFFKHGDVLVKDSRYSDWIYIVKSGSCSVMKKLKRTPPKISSKFRRETAAMTWNKGNQLGLVKASPSTLAEPRHLQRTGQIPSLLRRRHSWPSIHRLRQGIRTMSAETSKTDGQEVRMTKKLTTKSAEINGRDCGRTSKPTSPHKYGHENATNGNNAGGNAGKVPEDDIEIPEDFVENKRTFHSDLDAPRVTTEATEADLDPVFIVVEILHRGGVFGLHGSVFTDQPYLSVVSNGAECILIKKRFYLEHATDQTFAFLRRQETPYPSNEELQEKLQIYKNWNSFRNYTLKSTVYETRAFKHQRILAAT